MAKVLYALYSMEGTFVPGSLIAVGYSFIYDREPRLIGGLGEMGGPATGQGGLKSRCSLSAGCQRA